MKFEVSFLISDVSSKKEAIRFIKALIDWMNNSGMNGKLEPEQVLTEVKE